MTARIVNVMFENDLTKSRIMLIWNFRRHDSMIECRFENIFFQL